MRQTELKAESAREQMATSIDHANANTSYTSNTSNTSNTNSSNTNTSTTMSMSVGTNTSELPAPLPIRTASSIHSSLRVVTNPGELGLGPPTPSAFASGKWTPSLLRSPTSLLLSPLGMAGMKGFKTEDAAHAGSQSSGLLPDLSPSTQSHAKDLLFDARFLAEAWSQESPQSVYALLGQSALPFAGFSPLAASSPGSSRLLSPMGHHHHSLPHGSFQSQLQSFTSHLQSPLMAMSPLASSGHHHSNNTTTSANNSGQTPFYPPSVSIPASPHQLNPHLLSPLFATAISPGGGLGVSADMLSMIDPSTVFVPPNSPSAILRHLLPPIVPRPGGSSASLNVKELTLNELRPHFNKPMAVVAKELGVCITLMKKICRRNGLVRWPHRRIRSLVNRITSLQVIAGNSQGAEKKRFQAQINALRDELSAVIQNPNEKSRKAQADAKARSPTGASMSTGSRKRASAKSMGSSSDDDDDDEDGDDDEAEEQDENRLTQAKASRPTRQQPKPKQPRKVAASRAATATTPSPPAIADALPPRKRSTRFRPTGVPPPPIKIPRRSEYEAATRDLVEEFGERPSSTTSTGSCGKRGSISSILC